ncbi:MarR family winged helix-turn-helix transcriptional regulator [Qipengyuania vesicularis]|uniref:MarR family winged helix-turn-helix transcriptional regulator n=1 Tax=Qipengyuania vesicularis TaxID=2867232 RepID=UPI001C87932D|nr:MarR family winged helix-turn-helix transcriptional regulator [Qipengyuania vesicularis]MBX7526162.1 MarR family winged helix-turn-helix transcriptional regulator [Qipengyuania vesicularis]
MHSDFTYQPVYDGAGCQLAVTILGDRAAERDEMQDDALAAGFRVLECCSLEEFASGSSEALGDLVLVDCIVTDAATTAILSRLDMRAGKSGAQMVVSTSMAALDTVFGCFAMSGAQILVDARRADRVIAMGQVLAHVPNLRLRELAEEDRLMLLRLTEQVGEIAQRLEGLSPGQREGGGAFRLEAPTQQWRGSDEGYVVKRGEAAPRLPSGAAIRDMIRQRQTRAEFFDAQLFSDPAWDILLDLAASRAERRQVCVTSLCIAAAVPATTALRWISQMVEANLLVRIPDPHDRRRAHIALADATADLMARYFQAIGVVEQSAAIPA